MKARSIALQFIELKVSSSVWGKVWLVLQVVIIRRRWMCLRIEVLGEDVTIPLEVVKRHRWVGGKDEKGLGVWLVVARAVWDRAR